MRGGPDPGAERAGPGGRVGDLQPVRVDARPAGGVLRERYGSVERYLEEYAAAADAAIAAGFVLADDREALLAEARPDLVAAALE